MNFPGTGSSIDLNFEREGWLLEALKGMQENGEKEKFFPNPPTTLPETGLTVSQVEALILKYIWNRGTVTCQQISDNIRLPFPVIEEQVRRMKDERLLGFKRSIGINDYELELSELGVNLAKRYSEQMTYFGAAPVPFADYIKSVSAQSLTHIKPTRETLNKALGELAISDHMLSKLGQALTAGRALFLYGTPGNGKTSIAERVTAAFGEKLWIPRCISFDGDYVRLFDPIVHQELTSDQHRGRKRADERWVCIRRPTIIVGGELTMEHLEMIPNEAMGIVEAPMQLKSNCGTLVIDDFGRQKMTPTELLNRWIVPLEKGHDYQNLPSGKKVQVPFDQFLVFSTNLEPKNIVDEAFLRRIPYKIEVAPPGEAEFRKVFKAVALKLEVAFSETALGYLIEKHYREAGRQFRFCHPRDLLLQVKNYCLFNDQFPEMREEFLDEAVDNYFSMM